MSKAEVGPYQVNLSERHSMENELFELEPSGLMSRQPNIAAVARRRLKSLTGTPSCVVMGGMVQEDRELD